MDSEDIAEAVKRDRKAAEQGNAKAQFKLRMMYELSDGVPQNYEEAYFGLSLSAANGYEDAKKPRDLAVTKLSPSSLSAVQKRILEWKPKKQGQ